MRTRLLPRSIHGLAILAALASAIVTALFGFATVVLVHKELEKQLDQRIELETRGLLGFYRDHGFDDLAQLVTLLEQRSRIGDTGYLAGVDEDDRSTFYILVDAQGRRRAGSSTIATPPPGWSEFVRFHRHDGSTGVAQAMNSPLPDGGHLVIAADRTVINEMHRKILRLFAIGYGALLIVGAATVFALGRVIRRRLGAIEASAELIMAGDMTRRMPLDGSGGDFDRLSLVLNRMLDRIAALLDNLRQVSGDIAHDLRTPLGRLRNHLEAAETALEGAPQQPLVAAALSETDDMLELFSALLSISEIEGQSVRSRFVTVDLGEAIDEIVEAYRPAIDEAGMGIEVETLPVRVSGDRRLLQRCIASLLDNVLAHTPAGTHIRIAMRRSADGVDIVFADDGPGIPPDQHELVFRRLTRLDRSRSTPGHGLGLAIVAAIVAAHGGTVRISPTGAGLTILIRLPSPL